MHPIIATAATLLGAVLAARYLVKEWQRVNNELESMQRVRAEAPRRLRRDPATGVWRPE